MDKSGKRLFGALLVCGFVAFGAFTVLHSQKSTAATTELTVTRIVDGDTIYAGSTSIRIHGIDAPEIRQTCENSSGSAWSCGQYAKQYLEKLVLARGNRKIRCTLIDTDRYNRSIMRCSAPGSPDVGRDMVRAGLALAYRRYSRDYLVDENLARQRKRGMWAGRFQAPWDYRRGN